MQHLIPFLNLLNPFSTILCGLLVSLIFYQIFQAKKFKKKTAAFEAQITALENENERKAQCLHQLQRSANLSKIVGGIVHEINNPLSIIVGYSENMQSFAENKTLSAQPVEKHLSKILKATERAAAIVKSLRLLARDGSKDRPEPVSINAVLEECLGYLKAKIVKAGVKVSIEENDEELFTMGQSGEISQVILSLIYNTLEASSSFNEKWLKISCERFESEIKITFVDGGCGLPQEVQSRLMNAFFSTKQNTPGLGLSLSRTILNNHKGALEFDPSSPHTCFVVRLPLHEALPKSHSTSNSAAA